MGYRVIYTPRGRRSHLDVACVREHEEADWDIASRESFETVKAAEDHAMLLSVAHNIPTAFQRPAYLD